MWKIFLGMPAERDSAVISVELGRIEHSHVFGEVPYLNYPHATRLSDWEASPHYCASSVPDLAEELSDIATLDQVRGGKIHSILSVVKEAQRTGSVVSVEGGGREAGGVSSWDVLPGGQSSTQTRVLQP